MGGGGSGRPPTYKAVQRPGNRAQDQGSPGLHSREGSTDMERENATTNPGASRWELRYRCVHTAFSMRES